MRLKLKEQELQKKLLELGKLINETVKFAKKHSEPTKKDYRKWKIREFEYLKHIDWIAGNKINLQKEDWLAGEHWVRKKIENSAIFKNLQKSISKISTNNQKISLQDFSEKIIKLCFYNQNKGIHSIKSIAGGFISEFNNKPVKYQQTLELLGIALKQNEVKINPNIRLIKINKSYLEQEIPVEDFVKYREYRFPTTAILEINYMATSEHFDEHEIGHVLGLLRLFKVGEIGYNAHITKSQSSFMGFLHGDNRIFSDSRSFVTYFISKKEIPKLRKFWKIMDKRLPDTFKMPYFQTEYKTVAYDRYILAISHRPRETGITYAIMALESLFTKSSGEITFKLKARTAKVFGILGLNPTEIFENINEAYNIRSIFTHGEKLNSKLIRKIRQKYQYEEVLGLTIIDYVRIAIIIHIMVNKTKDEFIDLIDKALISDKGTNELKKALRNVSELLELQNYKPQFTIYPFNKSVAHLVI